MVLPLSRLILLDLFLLDLSITTFKYLSILSQHIMYYIERSITISRIARPTSKNINEELQWVARSLGLVGLRDKDHSCFRLFIELLKASKKGIALSSDDLAERLTLTRGTVVHHLSRLIDAGLVINRSNRYFLRVGSLTLLIEELEKDLKRTCDDLKEVAAEIDRNLG